LAIDNLILLASSVSSLLLINSFGWVFWIFYTELDCGVSVAAFNPKGMPQHITNLHLELLESIQAEPILMTRCVVDVLYEDLSSFTAEGYLRRYA